MVNVVSIAIAVVGILVAFIVQLMGSNRNLKDKVGELQGNAALKSLIDKEKEQENVAKNAEDYYNSLKSDYLNQPGDSSGNPKK